MNRKTILCLALAAAISVGCAAPVSAIDSAGLSALQSMGVIRGNTNAAATRGEFARMLVAVSGRLDTVSATASTSPFSDVPYNSSYAGYISTVVQEGAMSGYLDGTFRPDNAILLEEAVSAALSLLGYSGGTAASKLEQASSLGLLAGISKTQGQTLSVGECADLFDNLLSAKTSDGQTYAAKLGIASAAGGVDYTAVVSNSLQGPYLCTENVENVVPFSTGPAVVYLNGSRASFSDLDENDMIYYNERMQTVWAYRSRVIGTYTAASPDASAPTSVTVAGQSYEVTGSAAYALSNLGGISVGSTVTLLLDRDGKAAFALSGSHTAAASSSQDETAGVVTGVTVSSYTDASGREVYSYAANVVCADGSLRSYPVSSENAFREGDLVRVSGGVLTEEEKSSLRGTFNDAGTEVAGYTLADDAQILDYADSGSYGRVYSASLGGVTLNARNLLYYHLNASGQIDILILKDATGSVGSYGLVLSVTPIIQESPESGGGSGEEGGEEGEETEQVITGYTVTYLLNGQQSTVTLDAEASVSRGGAAFTFENGRVTGTTSLRRVAATQINGLTASTASGALSIADNAAVYVKIGSDYYQSTLATISGSSDYELTCYADRSSGGKVRVIVAEQK